MADAGAGIAARLPLLDGSCSEMDIREGKQAREKQGGSHRRTSAR